MIRCVRSTAAKPAPLLRHLCKPVVFSATALRNRFQALTRYGIHIGLAFQIIDDLLNVEGTEEQLGKAAGSDAARNKATYPALFGVDKTREKAEEAVQEALAALDGFDDRADSAERFGAIHTLPEEITNALFKPDNTSNLLYLLY